MTSYSEKMLKAMELEDLAEAQLMLEEALQNDSSDELEALADHLVSIGFLEEGQTIYETLLKQHPDAVYYNLPLAEIAMENNQIEEAFEYLEGIPKTSDVYPHSLMVAADLYQMLGIPEVSEHKLKEAQTLLPEEPLLDFALGELYFYNERYQEALVKFQGLADTGAESFGNIYLTERIGSSESMLGNFEVAVDYLEDALEKHYSEDNLFQLAFTYLQLKENQRAIALLQQLRGLNPQYHTLYGYLGMALQEEGLLEEAQEAFETGIKENPYYVALYHLAAENAYKRHDEEAAESFLKEALQLAEEKDNTRLTLSNLYLAQERYQEVMDVLKDFEEEIGISHWNRGKAAYGLEEYDLALAEYKKAEKELHHDMTFLKEYALLLREEGELEEAKQHLTHYLHHVSDDADAQAILDDLQNF